MITSNREGLQWNQEWRGIMEEGVRGLLEGSFRTVPTFPKGERWESDEAARIGDVERIEGRRFHS